MGNISIPLLFVLLPFLLSDCAALDTISAKQAIKDGETLVSRGEMYELGFFSPGNSKHRYLGIWYKKISLGTVVWVANRETPITDASGVFRVGEEGNLLITSGGNTLIWSSKSKGSGRSNSNLVAQLLDSGNLVVRDKNSTNQDLIWQSFDYPGDTTLPGMKFGKDLVTGMERYLTSWKSPDDPSNGVNKVWLETKGYPQIFRMQGSVLIARIGPWNGVGFSGFPIDVPNRIYSVEFVINQKEIYHKFELIGSLVQRVVLTWDGKTQILHWIDQIQDWAVYMDAAVGCGCFGQCGPFGRCIMSNRPPCECMDGFEPKIPEEWKASDWSGGCKRKTPLDCGSGDGFQKITGVKLPDTRFSWYNQSMSLGECEMACRRNCSCTAYADLDIRNGGSGCLLWFEGLMDFGDYDDKRELYVRMAASELAGLSQSRVNEKRVYTIVLSILSVTLLLSVVPFAYRKKKKRLHTTVQGKVNKLASEQVDHLDDIPSFSLYMVAKATNNFSISNKIGEGGFGTVYKGVLEDGQEVAVKRFSETSRQGLDEFKNELISVAKLQHRNLVKILGYCIHGKEMILIYEYMANKSLDTFLFDETRSYSLNWPQRFGIIKGIARGILYLHQDSRLQIIHRDLKASNILLDSDMNPKISDFGLARKFEGPDATAKTKKVVGTYGYISPEYAVHGRFSTKSDVFSFGVLVLEIVSGKKNREFSHEDHSDNLLGHAWRLYKEDKSIDLLSASLHASCIISEVQRSIHVGLLCVQHCPEDRPSMLSVILMLVSESALPAPKQPAFFTGEGHREHEFVSHVDTSMITVLYGR